MAPTTQTIYKVTDRETGNWILGEFNTHEEAEDCILDAEREDRMNNEYVENFYDIVTTVRPTAQVLYEAIEDQIPARYRFADGEYAGQVMAPQSFIDDIQYALGEGTTSIELCYYDKNNKMVSEISFASLLN